MKLSKWNKSRQLALATRPRPACWWVPCLGWGPSLPLRRRHNGHVIALELPCGASTTNDADEVKGHGGQGRGEAASMLTAEALCERHLRKWEGQTEGSSWYFCQLPLSGVGWGAVNPVVQSLSCVRPLPGVNMCCHYICFIIHYLVCGEGVNAWRPLALHNFEDGPAMSPGQ